MKALGIAVVATLVLTSCARAEAISPPPTIEAGKLTVCTDAPYEPFEFEENGELKGIDIDLSRKIAAELRIEARFRQVIFDDIFEDLAEGRCDMAASSVSITEERRSMVAFSDGYFEVTQSLLVRKADVERFDTLSNIGGRKVAVQAGTTGAAYVASKHPDAEVVPYESASQMVDALRSGDVDGAVRDFPVNKFAEQRDGALGVSATFTGSDDEEYGFAFAKDNDVLVAAVNRALKEARSDGTYDAILGTYLGVAG